MDLWARWAQPLMCLTLIGGAGAACVDTASPEATVTLQVRTAVVPGGQQIEGVATVDNRTGKPLELKDGTCNGWLSVGVSNGKVGDLVFDPLVGCAPAIIPTGLSRYPFTASTSYAGCGETGPATKLSLPVCTGPDHEGIPPLPPGVYHTFAHPPAPLKVINTLTIRIATAK